MISRRSIIVHTVLVLLGGVTWWLGETLFPPEVSAPQNPAGPVDYYSERIRRIDYDMNGKPEKLLVADLMTHFKNDDRTELEKPVMTLYRKDGSPPWIIDSDKAVTLSGSDVIYLQGNVLITKKNAKGEQLKIITSNVKYTPPEHFAETNEDVLMLTQHDELNGTGMQAQLEPNLVLKILANVRRKHETH
jgi:lipopolysaccharide export system protein LptC